MGVGTVGAVRDRMAVVGPFGEVVDVLRNALMVVHPLAPDDVHLPVGAVQLGACILLEALLEVFPALRMGLTVLVLFRVMAEIELLLAKVEEPVVFTVTESGRRFQDDLLDDVHGLVVEALVQDGPVVDTGQSDCGVDEVGHAALEERRQVRGVRAVDLFLPAVVHEVDKGFDGGAAEGVAVEVDLLVSFGLAEVFQDTGITTAEALVVVFLAVDLTVVNGAAENVSVDLTGSVPGTAEGAEGRCIDFITFCTQVREQTAGADHAPVVEVLAHSVIFTPTGKAVDEEGRVIVLVVVHW